MKLQLTLSFSSPTVRENVLQLLTVWELSCAVESLTVWQEMSSNTTVANGHHCHRWQYPGLVVASCAVKVCGFVTTHSNKKNARFFRAEKLYVFGGSISPCRIDGKFTDTVEALDNGDWEWRVVGKAPSKRSHLCAVVLNGKVNSGRFSSGIGFKLKNWLLGFVYLMGGYVVRETGGADKENIVESKLKNGKITNPHQDLHNVSSLAHKILVYNPACYVKLTKRLFDYGL